MSSTRQFASLLTRRRASALFCLLAAVFLQRPVFAAVAIASGACCTGDHCPIDAHHHAAKKAEETPMECEHGGEHGASKLRSCSISCCNSGEPSAVHSDVFLPSPVFELAPATPLPDSVHGFDPRETSVPSLPLSPPPEAPAILS